MECLRNAWIGYTIFALVFTSGLGMAAEIPDLSMVERAITDQFWNGVGPNEGEFVEIDHKMGPQEELSNDVVEEALSFQSISDSVDSDKGFTENDPKWPEQGIGRRRLIGISEEAEITGGISKEPLEKCMIEVDLPLLPLLERKAEESLPNQESKPKSIEPKYLRALTGIERGHNDSNPVWSPSSGMIAFERSIEDKKEIMITRLDGTTIRKIYYQSSDNGSEMDFFFPGIFEEVSYNAGISWSPTGDRFVFMSNGGGGNYDLYLCELGSDTTKRLTEHRGKDGQAQWSPIGNHLVFVSGRTGKADVYLMNLENNVTMQLTQGEKEFLYPHWSPNGRKIVMLYGTNENHDIYLIDDIARPAETLRAMTTWTYDDLRPVWSPDGQKIAFYSNYNPENDPKVWAIVVISADGSDPTQGEDLVKKIVATDVLPDMERGPAWMSDSKRIAFVKNDGHSYNPIYIVDTEEKIPFLLKTDTKMNHDVTCSIDGTIAFRAQVEQWDHIYIAKVE